MYKVSLYVRCYKFLMCWHDAIPYLDVYIFEARAAKRKIGVSGPITVGEHQGVGKLRICILCTCSRCCLQYEDFLLT